MSYGFTITMGGGMTIHPSTKLSFCPHVGNEGLRALLATVVSIVMVLVIGVLSGLPAHIGGNLFIPFLSMSCCSSSRANQIHRMECLSKLMQKASHRGW
jgi:hypothetical protein